MSLRDTAAVKDSLYLQGGRSPAPLYNQDALKAVCDTIAQLPPIVSVEQIERLKELNRSNAFIFCFGDCVADVSKLEQEGHKQSLPEHFQEMETLGKSMAEALGKESVPMKRWSLFKPRTAAVEKNGEDTIYKYFGEGINGKNTDDRVPHPDRLLKAHEWGSEIFSLLQDAGGKSPAGAAKTDYFLANEGLMLPYEHAMVREHDGSFYNTAAHFVWLGMRTVGKCKEESSKEHLDYFAGIANPVGVKVSAEMDINWFKELVQTLNPENTPGKLTLVFRPGRDAIAESLPKFLTVLKENGLEASLMCDPVHGNNRDLDNGLRTRYYDSVVDETKQFLRIVKDVFGTWDRVNGVMLETTEKYITECLGAGVEKETMKDNYFAITDPRFNMDQTRAYVTEITRFIEHDLNRNHGIGGGLSALSCGNVKLAV